MSIGSTPMDTKAFDTLLQLKDNTVKDSFDLYSGLFKHNKFARQEVPTLPIYHLIRQLLDLNLFLELISDVWIWSSAQLENLDAAFLRLKKKLLEETLDEQLEDRPALH
ncbi:ATP-binding cassette transporter CGR1 [Asimina triloba]